MRPVTLTRFLRFVACAGASVFLLASCGGGGGGDEPLPAQATAPTITQQPAGLSVVEGSPASFSVAATGSATLVYQWLRGGSEIAGATGSSYTLAAAVPADSGTVWTVRVSNSAGSVVSAPAVLTVTAKPAQTPMGVSFFAGEDALPGKADGTGRAARFNGPAGITADAQGNIYVADRGNGAIRKMTPAGEVTTVLDSTKSPCLAGVTDLAFDGQGVLHVISNGRFCRLAADGSVTLEKAGFSFIAPGPGGTIYLADSRSVYKLDTNGAAISLTPGSVTTPLLIQGLVVDAVGSAYIADLGGGAPVGTAFIKKVTLQGSVTAVAGYTEGRADGPGEAGRFTRPQGLAIDAAGDILVVDPGYALRKVTPDGLVSTPPGSPTFVPAAGSAEVQADLVVDKAGTVYFSTRNGIGKFGADGLPVALAGTSLPGEHEPLNPLGVTVDAAGNVYMLRWLGDDVWLQKYGPAGQRLSFGSGPAGVKVPIQKAFNGYHFSVAADGAGNVYVSEMVMGADFIQAPGWGSLYKVTPAGAVSVLAAGIRTDPGFVAPTSLSTDGQGSVYFMDVAIGAQKVMKVGADGGFTKVADLPLKPAYFFDEILPRMTVDRAGTVYYVNTVVRASTTVSRLSGGTLTTVISGNLNVGQPVADAEGNLFYVDGNLVRRLTPAGVLSTVAGVDGLATAFGPVPGNLATPGALAIGPDGVLYLAAGEALVRLRLK